MTLHLWLAFAAASLLMGLVPGPGVMSIVGYAIYSGRRTALASVAGLALGNLIAMSLSLAGVGALLAASATAFVVLKWLGALYLIGLGIVTLMRSTPAAASVPIGAVAISPRKAFVGNVFVGTFHPKTIVFFVAFVPQFISASAGYLAQAALLIATFTLVVLGSDTAYALLASRAADLLRTPRYALWSRRAGAGVMIAAGAATAATKG
jgi:threonine/homoserine/homoserine lactone efflux protein